MHGLSYLPTSLHAAWAQERWLALRQIGDPLADSALEAGLGYYKGRFDTAAACYFLFALLARVCLLGHSFECDAAFA